MKARSVPSSWSSTVLPCGLHIAPKAHRIPRWFRLRLTVALLARLSGALGLVRAFTGAKVKWPQGAFKLHGGVGGQFLSTRCPVVRSCTIAGKEGAPVHGFMLRFADVLLARLSGA